MSKQISFIHAADLHLDSPFKGLSHLPESVFQKVRKSTFDALERLVQTAIDKDVDFVLIVGDLFDNEKQSLKAQIHLRRAFEQLQQHHINVYLSYGNHDFINGNIHPVTYPENVLIFPEEKVTHFTYEKDDELKAAIYGFSYENRSVTANKVFEYNPVSGDIPFHIAMLHGSLHSNTEHDTYAPFHLSELTGKGFHYWALGHIHQREILKEQPPVIYPGNIQGRNRKETGEKGCYHVVVSESDTSATFMPLQSLQFNELTIDVSDCAELHQLEAKIQDEIETITAGSGPALLALTLAGSQIEMQQWQTEHLLDDVIELVNETIIHQSQWKYIFRFTIEYRFSENSNELAQGEYFVGELIRHADQADVQMHVNELFHHKQARRHMESMPIDDEQTVRNKAKQLLIHELLKNGGN